MSAKVDPTVPSEFQEPEKKQAASDQDKASEIDVMRVQWKKFMQTSAIGKGYTDGLLILSVLSCFQFIYQTYASSHGAANNAFDLVEKALAGLFSFDWCLSFFLADHKAEFVNSFFSMVDLLTVIPIWITSTRTPIGFNEIHNFDDFFTYLLFGLNTTRILRALRIHKKLMFVEDEVQRAMGNMILTVFVMLLFDSAVMQYLESHIQPLPFHTWMYGMWVTIATVGFGDIAPNSMLGRFAVMLVIGFAIVQVPKMTNDLLAKMALTSVFARRVYIPKKNAKHVIICGDLGATSIREIFVELFHEDHESSNTIALILYPSAPSFDIKNILSDPVFSLNVMYLEGNALNDRDLRRCCADTAEAIFVFSNKFSNNPDEEDAKTILQQFNLKRYCQFNNPFTPPFFCLQLIRPENQRHLETQTDTISAFADNDNDHNIIVCLNEIKMGIIAKSVMFPGASSLLLNLLTTIDDDNEEEEDVDGEDDDDVGNWSDEYHQGCDWEIYSTELAEIFVGRYFTEVSSSLYGSKGIVLFGIQVRDLSGKHPTRILLNPKDYPIPPRSEYEVTGYVIAKNKQSSDLSMKKVEGDSTQVALENLKLTNGGLMGRINFAALSAMDDSDNPNEGSMNLPARADPVSATELEDVPELREKSKLQWQNLLRQYEGEKNANESHQEKQQKVDDIYLHENFFIRDKPATLSECTIHSSVADEIPHLTSHVIILGKGLSNLFDLIRPLRAKTIGNISCIVILHPTAIPESVWNRISIFEGIFFIQGSALEDNDLRRAGIFRSSRVVVLADTQSGKGPGKGKKLRGDIAMSDADSIFSLQAVRRLNERADAVVEIVKQSNIGYLDPDVVSSGEGYYRFTPHFAAGFLFTTSMLDTLACQAFYNPQIIKLINRFVSSTEGKSRAEIVADAETGNKKKLRGLSAVVSSTLYQIGIPEGLESRTYGALFRLLATKGVIPIALYRGVFPQMKVGPKHNKMPYVFTNPSKDTELFSCDKVFVLSPNLPPNINTKESQRQLRIAEEELVFSSLTISGNIQATTAAMRDQFNVFNANQNIMRRHVDELSEDIKHKLGKVVKQMNNMKHGILEETANAKAAAVAPQVASPPQRRSALVSPSNFLRQRSGIRDNGGAVLTAANSGIQLRRGSNVSVGSTMNDEERRRGTPKLGNRKVSPSPTRKG